MYASVSSPLSPSRDTSGRKYEVGPAAALHGPWMEQGPRETLLQSQASPAGQSPLLASHEVPGNTGDKVQGRSSGKQPMIFFSRLITKGG
jgi:hypothetical protein